MRTFFSKFRALFSRDIANSEEFNTHLSLLAARFEAQGMSPQEADAAARRQFGNTALHEQNLRDQGRFLPLTNLGRDLRFAARRLSKSPGFAITAVLTLALGIGGATTIFSVVDGVLLKPLAYRDSGQLVTVWERPRFLEKLFPYIGANPRHEEMWAQQSSAFSSLAVIQPGAVGVSIGGNGSGDSDHPRFVGTYDVQRSFLDLLNVQPALGRNFLPEEDTPGHNHVVIISWPLWQSLFNGDENVIGKSVTIDHLPRTIVGVLAKDTYLPKPNDLGPMPKSNSMPATDILLPIGKNNFSDLSWGGDYGNFFVVGRLKSGVSVAQAQSQLNIIERHILENMDPNERNDDGDWRTSLTSYVQPMKEAIVGRTTRTLWLLFAAVLSVLLIACINLANAQLARSIARERESAVRSALGASAWSLVQTSLAEVALLSFTGAVLGVVLAWLAVHRVSAYAGLALSHAEGLSLSPTVLSLSLLLTLGSMLLFGLLPALRLLRIRPQQALQNSTRSAGTRGGNQFRRWLIGLQIFACTTLLLITGLFAKSFVGLLQADKGFSSDHLVAAEVILSGDDSTAAQKLNFDDTVLARLDALPGVQAAGLSNTMLLTGESHIDGVGPLHGPNVLANYRYISPGYFSSIGEQMAEGRALDDSDRTQKNAVISQATARTIFPDRDALGQQIGHNSDIYTVVGIAADAHNTSLRATAPVNMVYLGYWARPSVYNVFLVRSSQDTTLLADAVRKTIWSYDPTLTIVGVRSLDSRIHDVLSPERLETTILCAFGGAALLLVLLGIYGTLSYSVETRRQEIGIRMALGATRGNVYRVTLSEVLLPIGAGLLLGWLASLGIGHAVASLLYGTKATDASVAIAVLVLFAVASTIATVIPCRRATKVDPMQSLRAE